ncbi:MAG: hypothetical protein KF819_06755 [Labilithrix sp.]|nr:hypothetical protein [Labilithrix sp.]
MASAEGSTEGAPGEGEGERDPTREPEKKREREPEKLEERRSWLEPESRSRRILLGLGIYLACLVVFAIIAGDRMAVHTPYNHFAHLADAWLHGRHDLRGGPPGYAGNNDFALFEGKWFISFPPFPAILMMPVVAVAGSPENFRDAQFVVWLAGIGPAGLFLVLEKMRRTRRSERTEIDNLRLALLFAFGTVYFFSAVQGTVWFAAHVIGVGLMALFVLCSLDAERPALAGALLGCMFLTRVTTVLVGALFVFEAIRVSYMKPTSGPARELPREGPLGERIATVFRDLDRGRLLRLGFAFAAPCAVALAFASWLNWERFHDPRPWAFGHEYLTVGWQARIKRWGLFSFHFLPRNLSIMLASLPWRPAPGEPFPGKVPFMISGHGLALWMTSPFYLWLLRPKNVSYLTWAAGVAALGPLVMNLLYQNSGWFQFGYRFSNDYAILLFMMLAIGTRRFGTIFWAAAAWAIAWNLFGAVSFERQAFGLFYSQNPGAVFPID